MLGSNYTCAVDMTVAGGVRPWIFGAPLLALKGVSELESPEGLWAIGCADKIAKRNSAKRNPLTTISKADHEAKSVYSNRGFPGTR
jgi:hypothetical protein